MTHHTSSTLHIMTNWNSLPPELRLMILELLGHKLSSHAPVCRVWQDFIEEKTFRRLRLEMSRLDEFEAIVVGRRRQLVKHLWLNIELPEYTCRMCGVTRSNSNPLDSWKPKQKHTSLTSKAIKRLFEILRTWNPDDAQGLTLELTAQSKSNGNHWFKNCFFGRGSPLEDSLGDMDSVPDPTEMSMYQDACAPFHDEIHGWVDGSRDHQAWEANCNVLLLFQTLGDIAKYKLPVVPVVTELVIRRQCRRLFSPFMLDTIYRSLPRLEALTFEPWRPWIPMDLVIAD